MIPSIPNLNLWLIGAAILMAGFGIWKYGDARYDAGVRNTTAAFVAADKKGAETVHETARKTLADIGDDPDPDSLLRETGGLRDDESGL